MPCFTLKSDVYGGILLSMGSSRKMEHLWHWWREGEDELREQEGRIIEYAAAMSLHLVMKFPQLEMLIDLREKDYQANSKFGSSRWTWRYPFVVDRRHFLGDNYLRSRLWYHINFLNKRQKILLGLLYSAWSLSSLYPMYLNHGRNTPSSGVLCFPPEFHISSGTS